MRVKLVIGIVAGAVVAAALTAGHAQEPPKLRAEIVSVTESDYPSARAVVNVEDAGDDIKTLAAGNFAVTVGGKPATVQSADLASSQNAPLDVLLLMDVSGSMAGEPIKQTKDAAAGLVGALALDDRVAVISFADAVTLVQDYTTDRAAILGAIDGLSAKGNTALYDATAAAAYKAGTSLSSRRAIILLSDGAQDGVTLKTTRDQALAAASGVQVPFFAIGEGTKIDAAYLTQLAATSRGRYLEAPKLTDLGGLFTSIGALLTSQFIVRFDASAAAGIDESPVTITLHANAGTVTAQGSFRPGPGFKAPAIALTLTGLTAGESLTEPRVVTATPDRAERLTRVAFYVDGVNAFETDTPPYAFTYDPRQFGASGHTLKAAAIAGTDTFESAAVSFTSRPPATAPAGSGGLSMVVIAALVAGVAIALVAGFVVFTMVRRLQRRGDVIVASADQRITPWASRHRPVATVEEPVERTEQPVEEAQDIGEPMGVLIARGGPLIGTEYLVGGKPVSIGAGARCAVRIDDEELSAEEARIWVRDGHLMLHKMMHLSVIAADGVSGGWTILEPGDHLTIGEHRFEFRVWTPPLPETEGTDGGPVPNVLREVPRGLTGEPRPMTAPAPSSNLGAIWPREASGSDRESDELDAQAS